MQQVIIGGCDGGLDTSTTQYIALQVGSTSWGTTESSVAQCVSTAGVIKNLRVRLSGSPGAGDKWVFTLMLNGAPTALTLEIAEAATSGSNIVNEIDVVAGDIISLEENPDVSPTAGRSSAWTAMFEGSTANESLILLRTGVNTTVTRYSHVMDGKEATSSTEDEVRQICPTAGVIKNLYVNLDVDPGTAPDAYRFTLRLNGATVGESLIVTIVANDTTGSDTAHNLVVAAGDVLTLMIEPISSPSVSPKVRIGMTFLADTDGESIILGGRNDAPINGGTEYNNLSGSPANWIGTEAFRYQLGQVCTLKKLYILLDGTPGSGKKYAFTARVAGGGTVVAEVVDLNTTGNSGALEDNVANDDYLSLRSVPTGTPTARKAYWGLVGYIAPVVAPTVTTQAATDITDTTATGNGNITDTGGENCTKRGIAYDTVSRGDPGSLSPAASAYANYVEETGSFGTGAFTRSLTSLPIGTTIYARAYAYNTAGYNWGSEVSFLTLDPILVTPTTLALILTTYVPTITIGVRVIPSTLALSLTTYAPTIEITEHVTVTPSTLALSLTTFVPTVSTPRVVTPGTLALTLTTYTPTVLTPILVTPGTLALSLTLYAPTVSTPRLVTPSTLALILSTFTPTVLTPRVVTPDTLALILTTYAADIITVYIALTLKERSLSLTLKKR